MTPERAKHIHGRQSYGSLPMAFRRRPDDTHEIVDDGITREEDASIRALWRTMPGHTCYMDAVLRIARGERPPRPPRGWYCEATIVEWDAAAGDYSEVYLDHYSREVDPRAVEDDAREAWGEHGQIPEVVTVTPRD